MTKTELLSTYTKDRLAEMVLELQVAAGLRYDKIQMLKWEVSNLENMIGGLREIIGTYKNGILPRCTKQAKEAIDNDCFEKVMVVTCREWSDKPGKEENQPDIRKFEAKIDSLQSEVEKYRKALEVEKEKRECQISEYQKKIEELEKPVTENKVNLQWGQREILGIKMENLQMTADNILREVKCLEQRKNMFEDKERRTPRLYANVIIEDTSDFHNFWGDDKMHEKAEMRRVDFLREIAEHLLVYCNHNGEVEE